MQANQSVDLLLKQKFHGIILVHKMQAIELVNILDQFPSLKSNFDGIFAIDTLPRNLKIRHFLICNTDEAKGPGKHWFVILRLNKFKYELFDSLTLNQEKIELLQTYCNFKTKYLKYNKTIVQSDESTTCGQFCLYFIIHRMHNLDLSFSTLLNTIFSLNVTENEESVKTFLKSMK